MSGTRFVVEESTVLPGRWHVKDAHQLVDRMLTVTEETTR